MDDSRVEFSHRTRREAIRRMREERFDLLIVGGGITGAATARDAVTRGLKVALIEKSDFASGTSSRSSKLIHGGLRYLQNLEFGLIFEALSERAHLLKSVPHMVRPLPFFLPVYDGDNHGRAALGLGLWIYDWLALFRAPGFTRMLSRKNLLSRIPFLREKGLRGGFRYFDASMWDDMLAVETLRDASRRGVAVANYLEAVEPLREGDRVTGLRVVDRISGGTGAAFDVRAAKVVVCAGPWTDLVGARISERWRNWLNPSKGIHLVFDLKRIPIPGAVVMAHPDDGRISFVIPRPDFGAGVVIVGTTDGPTPPDPEAASIDPADVDYLLDLMNRYFPTLKLGYGDIVGGYVGVRPLMGAQGSTAGSEGQATDRDAESLQKVSREHYIGRGPGGVVLVAGGKYTTHRRMAGEIVDFTLKQWERDARRGDAPPVPGGLTKPCTLVPVNPAAVRPTPKDPAVPAALRERYGGEAAGIVALARPEDARAVPGGDPEGFPYLAAQLRHAIRNGMVVHLEDFFLRRAPLFMTRKDHGLPWAPYLAKVWAEETGAGAAAAADETARLTSVMAERTRWLRALSGGPGRSGAPA